MCIISASILNADLANLSNVAKTVENAGADALHYDVMDGCFVDNISFGLPVLHALRRCTELPLDVHLMVKDPLRFVSRFVEAGAQYLSFHIESDSDPVATVDAIHSHGIAAGIALCPDTPLSVVLPLLPKLKAGDFILLMTVEPGWGKQAFIYDVLPKIRQLRAVLDEQELPLHIQVDGGIQEETAAICREAGVDFLVSGSYLMNAPVPADAVRYLRGR
ncbi:MAG: ribulose-phosphate 3-epimerase [Oscillospiraceae bacterium]|nr:ribulose-phosphate 3-epimerase [Oscillospiraceae bacterium]